jgi:hypothetical protein
MITSKIVPLPFTLALAAGLSACADAQPGESWAGSVDTLSSGVVVVTNPSRGLWGADQQWRVEEVLRIGEPDGTSAAVFGRIGRIEIDADGRIYVFDSQANELRIFNGDGSHSHTRGRSGEGPGEFRSLIGTAVAPDGTLWLVDAVNARYTLLGPGGTAATLRRRVGTYRLPWLGGVDSAGRFYDQATERVDGRIIDVVLALDSSGTPVESARLPSVDLRPPRAGSMEFPLPYSASIVRAWDRSAGIWQAVTSEYIIHRISLSGDTSLVIRRSFDREPLSQTQHDSVNVYARSLAAEFNVAVPRELHPTHVPPLRWLAVDDDGNLWVCATGLAACDELEVFNAQGRFLGAVALPTPVADAPVPVIRRGHMYAVVQGPSGEPQLLKARVVRP